MKSAAYFISTPLPYVFEYMTREEARYILLVSKNKSIKSETLVAPLHLIFSDFKQRVIHRFQTRRLAAVQLELCTT